MKGNSTELQLNTTIGVPPMNVVVADELNWKFDYIIKIIYDLPPYSILLGINNNFKKLSYLLEWENS